MVARTSKQIEDSGQKISLKYLIWCLRSVLEKDHNLVGCDALLTGNMLRKFRRNFLPPASRSSQQFGYPEAGGITLVQNVIKYQSIWRHIPDSSNLITYNVCISLSSRFNSDAIPQLFHTFPTKTESFIVSWWEIFYSLLISVHVLCYQPAVLQMFPHRDCL